MRRRDWTPAWLIRVVQVTRAEYFADFFITPPITLGLGALSIARSWSWAWIPAFLAGWFAWTLYEYVVHRWLSHGLLWSMHGLHHARQRDYIALPPWMTLAVYGVVWLLFGFRSSPFAVGFSVGYCAYAALHVAFHYATIGPGHPLYALRMHHVGHHRWDDVNYGVSFDLWDRVFGSIRSPGR